VKKLALLCVLLLCGLAYAEPDDKTDKKAGKGDKKADGEEKEKDKEKPATLDGIGKYFKELEAMKLIDTESGRPPRTGFSGLRR
jgi:hypothetical protein